MSACSANFTFYCACFSHQIPCLHSSFVLVFPSVFCTLVCCCELSKFIVHALPSKIGCYSAFAPIFPSVVCIPVCSFELSKFYILLCMLCPSNIRFAQCFCPHSPSVFCRLVYCFELSTLINISLCMLHPLDIGLAQCFTLDFHLVICMLVLIFKLSKFALHIKFLPNKLWVCTILLCHYFFHTSLMFWAQYIYCVWLAWQTSSLYSVPIFLSVLIVVLSSIYTYSIYCACFAHQTSGLHRAFVPAFPSVFCMLVCCFELSILFYCACFAWQTSGLYSAFNLCSQYFACLPCFELIVYILPVRYNLGLSCTVLYPQF